MQWRSTLDMPAGPRVTEIVPSEVLDLGTFQGLVPSRRAHLLDRSPLEREHVIRVLADLLLHDRHGCAIEWHRNRLARLRLVGMHPRHLALEVDRRPLQSSDVGRAQTGLEATVRDSTADSEDQRADAGEDAKCD